MDYKREMAHAVNYMLRPMVEHLDNNHKPFINVQVSELSDLMAQIDTFFNYMLHTVKEKKFDDLDNLISEREKIFEFPNKIEKTQIKRIKNKEVNTRNSQLFFKIIAELRTLLLLSINLVKSKRDFIIFTRQAK